MTSRNGESFREQLSRLHMMADDDGETWDLSRNDQAALRAVVNSHAALTNAIRKFLDKWALVEPHINAQFALSFARSGQQYNGPSLAEELSQLHAVLTAVDAKGKTDQ